MPDGLDGAVSATQDLAAKSGGATGATPPSPPPATDEARDRRIFREMSAAAKGEATPPGEKAPATGGGGGKPPASSTATPAAAPPKPKGSEGTDRREIELIATAVLKRDQYDDETIKEMLAWPEARLNAVVEKRRAAQQERDRAGRELAGLKSGKPPEQPQGQQPGRGQQPAVGSTPPPEPTDPIGVQIRAHTKKAEYYDSIGDDQLATIEREAAEQLGKMRGPQGGQGQRPGQAPQLTDEQRVERLRSRFDGLQDRYSELKKPENRLLVVRKLGEVLAQTPGHAELLDADALIELATVRAFPRDDATAQQARLLENRETRKGFPKPPSNRSTVNEPLEGEARDRRWLQLVKGGMSEEEATRTLDAGGR